MEFRHLVLGISLPQLNVWWIWVGYFWGIDSLQSKGEGNGQQIGFYRKSVPGFSMFFGTSTVGFLRWEIQVNPVVQLTLGTFRKRSILQEEIVSSSKKPVFFRGHEPFVLGGGVTLNTLRYQLISINIAGWKIDPEWRRIALSIEHGGYSSQLR